LLVQAPGSKVHPSGIPFDDASGERLLEWIGGDRKTFYDDSKIAILPMGFCFLVIAKENPLIYRRLHAVLRPGDVTL
jgi:uracil-DNA glycosylase